MGLFDQWPYTNFHELNLEWILRRMRDLTTLVENFVALNTIKYADPIQWNITTQYEANTVVVDPQSGTAYISTKPVPAGVVLTNTNYWSVIFTLDVISANKNITLRDDGSNVLATFASVAGDWLLWNGTLYKVSQNININEAYVAGYNLTRYTVELFIEDYITAIKNDIGSIRDLNTTDKSNLVAAINEVLASTQLISNIYEDAANFGIVPDQDCTDALIDAIADGHTRLFFKEGNYIIKNAVLTDNVDLKGLNATLLVSIDNNGGYVLLFDTSADLKLDGFNITSNTRYTIDQSRQHTLIKCSGSDNVVVKNCKFTGLYNATSGAPTAFTDRLGFIITCVNCDNVDFINNEISDLAGDELFFIISSVDSGYHGIVNFNNNYIHDMSNHTESGVLYIPQSINIFADIVNIKDNIVDSFTTTVSFIDYNCRIAEISGNRITGSTFNHVFNSWEYGYLYSMTLNAHDNYIEVKNSVAFLVRGENISVRNNTAYCRTFYRGSGNTISANVTPWSTSYQVSRASIIIENNKIYAAYSTDGANSLYSVLMPYESWRIQTQTQGLDADSISILNNVIDYTKGLTYSTGAGRWFPICAFNNAKNITVSNNKLFGTPLANTSTTVYLIAFVAANDNDSVDMFEVTDNNWIDIVANVFTALYDPSIATNTVIINVAKMMYNSAPNYYYGNLGSSTNTINILFSDMPAHTMAYATNVYALS